MKFNIYCGYCNQNACSCPSTITSTFANTKPWDDRSELEIAHEQLKVKYDSLKSKADCLRNAVANEPHSHVLELALKQYDEETEN